MTSYLRVVVVVGLRYCPVIIRFGSHHALLTMLISPETLTLFLITTFIVVISPGPAAIAVSVEAGSNGYRRSIWVIIGIAMGNVIFFILSATGIAALIIASNVLFMIVKWAGVCYLLYLGLTAIYSQAGALQFTPGSQSKKPIYRIFLKGFILELSNPKALLYFSALLPQFIDIDKAIIPQLLVLGGITFFIDFFCYSLYGLFAHHTMKYGLKPIMIKIINRLAGTMLIFAGLKMATVER